MAAKGGSGGAKKADARPSGGGSGPAPLHYGIALPLAVVSGCLVFLSFQPWAVFPLQWFSLAPLVFAARGRRLGGGLLLGFVAGFVTNFGGFHWMTTLLAEFGHMGMLPRWAVMALMAAYQAIPFTLATGIAAAATAGTRFPWILVFPFTFTAAEYAVPFIFPWYFANGQQPFTAATQLVEITGVAGLTFLLVVVSCALAEIPIARRDRRPFPWLVVIPALLLFAGDIGFGLYRIREVDAQVADAKKLKIGMVEANVGIWEKEAKNPDGSPMEPYDQVRMLFANLLKHQFLSARIEAEAKPDLIVWPESSYMPWTSVYSRRTGTMAVALATDGRVLFLTDEGVKPAPGEGEGGARIPGAAAVAAANEGQIVVVGARGAIHTFDGAAWKRSPVATDRDLFAVAIAPNEDDALAVGDQGIAVRRKGGEWHAVELGTTADLRGVAWAGDRFVVCGSGGTLLAYDGKTATKLASTSAGDLAAVAWSPQYGTVVAGADGSIQRIPAKGTPGGVMTSVHPRFRSAAVGEDAWIASTSGALFRCNRESCQHAKVPEGHLVTAVSSDWDGQVWAVGPRGTVARIADGEVTLERSAGADLSAVAWVPYREGYPLPRDVRYLYVAKAPLPAGDVATAAAAADADARTSPRDRNAAIRGFSTPLLFGAITYREKAGQAGESEYMNTAFLIDGRGKVLGAYDKNYLLIFGEYLPFAEWFPFLKKWLPEAGDFAAGKTVDVFEMGDLRIGPMICYEDIIPSFTRRLADKEPNLLVNVTNDAWFGKTGEPYLHLQLATFRAIENRLFMVRSTNTGVSAIVDPLGRLVSQTDLDTAETVVTDVALLPGGTIYRRIGDVFAWACCGVAFALLIVGARRRKARGG